MNHKLQPEQIEAAAYELFKNEPGDMSKYRGRDKAVELVGFAESHYLPIIQKQSELLERAVEKLRAASDVYLLEDYPILRKDAERTITEIEQHLNPKS